MSPAPTPGFLYQQNTIRDALVAAVHFDAFHRHADRVVMANIAQTVNVLQAMLLTDGDRLVRTPTYHVFEMNKGHHDARALAVPVRQAPEPSTGGTRGYSVSASRADRSALISLSNLALDETLRVSIDLRGHRVAGGSARLLDGSEVSAHNTVDAPDAVAPRPHDVAVTDNVLTIELPPHSFGTVSLEL